MQRKTNSKPQQLSENLKTGTILDLTVTRLDEDGCGLSSVNDIPVRIAGTFPGELVRARITHCSKETITARCLNLTQPSPYERVSSPSHLCKECDGCPLIQLSYSSQLAIKKVMVQNCLSSYPSLQQAVLHDTIPSPKQLNYRSTVKLVVSGTYKSPRIGIYRRNSHDVLDITDCPLHHPLVNTIVAAVKDGIKRGKVPVYSPSTGSGILRYLVIRVSETGDQAMVVFVTAHRSFNEIHHLGKYLKTAVPQVSVIAQNENSTKGNVILGEKFHFLTKKQCITAHIGTIRFSVSPRSFFQINSEAARLIYELVAQWGHLNGNQRIIDVYCGIGSISLFLAGKSAEVYGIEVVETAVSDAVHNARANGIKNCIFEAGDAKELLAELREEKKQVDLLILNPPRKGCDRQVLEEAAQLGPPRLIYVSCSPLTLSRDLNILSGLGYATLEVQPVDMFPQTQHIENVALLVKA